MCTVLDSLETAAAKRLRIDAAAPVIAGLTPGQRPLYADDIVAFVTNDDSAIDGLPFGKPIVPGGARRVGRAAATAAPKDGVVRIRVPKEFAK